MKQFAIFILALALVPVVLGQSPATGFPPYGSFQPGGFDSVNMQNLNVNFAIGMISKPARGGRINLSAVYNSLNWQADNSTGTWTWIPTPNSNWGWSIGNPTGSLYDPPTLWMQICWYGDYNDLEGDYQEEDYNTFIYIDASGTQHRFPVSYDVVVHDDCASDAGNSWGTFTGYATDGSGYYIDISDFNYPKIFSPGGGRVGVGANSPTDRNGNVMTYGAVTGGYGWIDSTGHGFRVDQVSGTSNYEYHYADSTGTDQKYTVKYQNYSVMTSFSCSGVAEYNGAGTMPQVSLPYEIDLPNGKSYAFTYEQTPGNSSCSAPL
jgi:hypothetical protein